MKTIAASTTYITAGHMAVRCQGVTIAQCADKNKVEKLVESKVELGPLDRVVDPSDFVQATGITLSIAGEIYKPRKESHQPKTKPQVTSLIRD